MPRKPKLLLSNTVETRPKRVTRDLWYALQAGDFVGARRHLAMGAELDVPVSQRSPRVASLTATAMAARADSLRDELFFLPWILNRGGNIAEVDGGGRTLLDHAHSPMTARYLLENGVPVADGMRTALVEAFRKPPGAGTFDKAVALAAPTGRAKEPSVFAMVRNKTAAEYTACDPVHVPKARWRDVLSTGVFDAMTGAGLGEDNAVARARDPLFGAFGPQVRADVFLNAHQRLLETMWNGDRARVAALLEVGACNGQRGMPEPGSGNTDLRLERDGISAAALAALLDSAFGPGGPRTTDGWYAQGGTLGGLHLLPLFDGVADFGGVHAYGGRSLLHLDLAPAIVEWLVERGAPYDLADDEENVPEKDEVWPEDARGLAVAAIYARHRLSSRLPAAGAPPSMQRRRL